MTNYTGPSWPGLSGIKHLVIFGDSYSSVGYNKQSPHPTPEEPLGVEFPGLTWVERGQCNWVGHVLKARDEVTLVYDYAIGGATISRQDTGIGQQVQFNFLPTAGQRPAWAPWNETDTLFVTWIGVNDCAYSQTRMQTEQLLGTLFRNQEKLYQSGARNFLFIEVPPMDKSPAAMPGGTGDGSIFMAWNEVLRAEINKFSTSHPGITTLLFPAWSLFGTVLRNPLEYNFAEEDAHRAGGGIWRDSIHPTSKMHAVIAREITGFLEKYPALC